jgi:hypothetical protein
LEVRLHWRIVFGVLLMIVGTVFVAIIAVRFLLPPSPSIAALPSVRTVNSDGPSRAASTTGLPLCPPAGLQALQPSRHTGHHKVILSWKASAPSPDPERNPVGYCLYRSKKQHSAKRNPTCSDCEQINPTPVVGTGCVDDLVLDDATYYYVVIAITANRKISSAWSETLAQIPSGKKSAKPVPANSYPLCRGSANSK